MIFKYLPIDLKYYIIKSFILQKCKFCNKKIIKTFELEKTKLCEKCFNILCLNIQFNFDNND